MNSTIKEVLRKELSQGVLGYKSDLVGNIGDVIESSMFGLKHIAYLVFNEDKEDLKDYLCSKSFRTEFFNAIVDASDYGQESNEDRLDWLRVGFDVEFNKYLETIDKSLMFLNSNTIVSPMLKNLINAKCVDVVNDYASDLITHEPDTLEPLYACMAKATIGVVKHYLGVTEEVSKLVDAIVKSRDVHDIIIENILDPNCKFNYVLTEYIGAGIAKTINESLD